MADSSLELVQPAVVVADVAPSAASHADTLTLAAFDHHAASLVRYVRTFGLGLEEAEDVVQEAFLALFQHLSLGRDHTYLRGWLFRVAHNVALKRRRKMHRQPLHCSWDEPAARAETDRALSPELAMLREERRQHLRAVIIALPSRDRQCLLLRAEGLTYREIAKTLGASLGAVAKSLTRVVTRIVASEEGHTDV